MRIEYVSDDNEWELEMLDHYSRLAACLWHLSHQDLADLVVTAESLAIRRFHAGWPMSAGEIEPTEC